MRPNPPADYMESAELHTIASRTAWDVATAMRAELQKLARMIEDDNAWNATTAPRVVDRIARVIAAAVRATADSGVKPYKAEGPHMERAMRGAETLLREAWDLARAIQRHAVALAGQEATAWRAQRYPRPQASALAAARAAVANALAELDEAREDLAEYGAPGTTAAFDDAQVALTRVWEAADALRMSQVTYRIAAARDGLGDLWRALADRERT